MKPAELIVTVRQHWQIENGLHRQLDVAMRRMVAPNREDAGPVYIAILRRRALDVARADTSKCSMAERIKRRNG
jgi:predicted transposase YbfD/YdcC